MRTIGFSKWIVLLSVAPVLLRAADPGPPRVTWAEFSGMMTPKHTVRMVLPDGTHVQGKVLRANSEGLEIRIRSTSNPQVHPKGEATIPRESLSVVDVRSPRSKGKLIGTLVPIGVGAGILAAGVGDGGDEVYVYLVAGGTTMGFGGVAGFFIGRAVDRRFQRFVIAQ